MYVTPAEVREVATGMPDAAKAVSSPANISASALSSLIERASRYIDLCCGVEPGYFNPAYYPVWQSLHVYSVGDIVTPTTRQLHKYRVTQAGTSGASEPVFPTGSGGAVTNGNVVFTEYGADVVATNKTVYGDGTSYLKLPPYVAGTLNTTLTLLEGYTAPTFIERNGYLLFTTSNGLAPPFSYALDWFSGYPFPFSQSGWYLGVPIIISAVWGYETTPEDIKMAVIEMTINLWRETDPANLKLVNIDNQPLRERMPPRVSEVAKRYRVKGVAFV